MNSAAVKLTKFKASISPAIRLSILKTERERDRQTDRDRDGDRQRQRLRQRETQRETERERKTETEEKTVRNKYIYLKHSKSVKLKRTLFWIQWKRKQQ